jgi:hypothetical protein
MQALPGTNRITSGFIMSVVAGVLVLLNGILWFMLIHFLTTIPEEAAISAEMVPVMILSFPFIILGIMGILFAIGIFIGSALIYLYGNKSTGGKIVLVFAILSIASGGGFIMGMAVGIVGGAYAVKKK